VRGGSRQRGQVVDGFAGGLVDLCIGAVDHEAFGSWASMANGLSDREALYKRALKVLP